MARKTRRGAPASASESDSRGTVARVLELLRCLADGPDEWTISGLSDELRLPASTVHRLLALLRAKGFVDADDATHRYRAGGELYRLASILAARMPILRVAMPILHEIVERCDETALLGIYHAEGLTMSYAAKVESRKPVRYVLDLNVPQSLLWGSTGRVILAFLDDKTVDRAVLRNEPSPVTSEHIDPSTLRDDLRRIRAQGYARSHGQRTPTAVGLAVPWFGANAAVLGTLSLTIPDYRFDPKNERALVKLLKDGARRLSRSLGFDDTAPRAQKDPGRALIDHQ